MENPFVSPPWVSFCMSTRGRPHLLRETLRSIQGQTIKDFEVIICDNDPDASAEAVVKAFCDDRLHYHHNGRDLGMIASFNRSLSMARGSFVIMITDDDPVYPDLLETLKSLSEEYPGYGAYSGGCDVLHTSPAIAKLTLHRVGRNSCLASIPFGSVRAYSSEQFPHAFFSGEVDMYLLWSVGMVRREIAQKIKVPDYGSPYMGDLAYTASTLSAAGCVVVNRSVGCQTVHDFNFGRKECGELKTAALGFNNFIAGQFSVRADWRQLKPKVEKYVGQWIVLHSIFLRQYFINNHINEHNLPAVLRELFKISYIRELRFFYYAGTIFLTFQQQQIKFKNLILRRMRKSLYTKSEAI